MRFTDNRKGCPYGFLLNWFFVADDAYIVPKKFFTLFACGESVRRDAEPYGFSVNSFVFRQATVEDGSPVPHKPSRFLGTLRTAFPTEKPYISKILLE